jgi:hypothetical protein
MDTAYTILQIRLSKGEITQQQYEETLLQLRKAEPEYELPNRKLSITRISLGKKLLAIFSITWFFVAIAISLDGQYEYSQKDTVLDLLTYFAIPQSIIWGTVWLLSGREKNKSKSEPTKALDAASLEKTRKRYSRISVFGWIFVIIISFSFFAPDHYTPDHHNIGFIISSFIGAALLPLTGFIIGLVAFIKTRAINSLLLASYATGQIILLGYRMFT